MEKVTQVLLAILLISGSLVTGTLVYISTFNNIFLGTAIVTWDIVVITVFVLMVYEIYQREITESIKNP